MRMRVLACIYAPARNSARLDIWLAFKHTTDCLIRNMRLRGLTGSAISHRSIAPRFKPRPGYVRRVFHLTLRLITFGGRSAHLAYAVHKSGRKAATFNSK